jgi:hypothetical protein
MDYHPAQESYSLRSKDWRYIRYENGKEELYHTSNDPHEWNNLDERAEHAGRLIHFRKRLLDRIPQPGTIPPQPKWKPKGSSNPNSRAEAWKSQYFSSHPAADANKDGKLTWSELKAYREVIDPSSKR